MRLVFATGNKGKLREAREILGDAFEVVSPYYLGVDPEVEETGTTFQENSLLKAQHLYKLTGLDCFADDSGLEVDALDGAPGIYTARYAALAGTGSDHNFEDNIDRLLYELNGVTDRRARFKCVATLMINGVPHSFEGVCEGKIAYERAGCGGFGYDPVFIADAFPDKTLAEVPEDEKNLISHRGVALRKMAEFLAVEFAKNR